MRPQDALWQGQKLPSPPATANSAARDVYFCTRQSQGLAETPHADCYGGSLLTGRPVDFNDRWQGCDFICCCGRFASSEAGSAEESGLPIGWVNTIMQPSQAPAAPSRHEQRRLGRSAPTSLEAGLEIVLNRAVNARVGAQAGLMVEREGLRAGCICDRYQREEPTASVGQAIDPAAKGT
jgi:hypothetical protein